MIRRIQRALQKFREGGLLKNLYNNKIWPLLPPVSEHGTYNGVKVKGRRPVNIEEGSGVEIRHRIMDHVVPWGTPSKIPDFKQPNTDQIHRGYQQGDRVTIIGGGFGVSAVHSARTVGRAGRVVIYEADRNRIEDLEKTIAHNGVEEICDIHHAIVGRGHLVQSPGDADIVPPSDLPDCDSLELDCEGAELEILDKMEISPRTIIVELHHKKEYCPYSSAQTIQQLLVERGYSVRRHDGPWTDGLFVARLE